MPRSQQLIGWVVFAFSAGAYIPLAIGGLQHPEEINIASYSLWLILSSMLLYSSRAQDFAGWRMPLGFFIGNSSMLVLAFALGGYKFNLGLTEIVVLYGMIGAIAFATVRWMQGHKGDVPRILFLGSVAADILSFYPQLKQYLEPHDAPTYWMLLGWAMWIVGAFINVALVEKMVQKLWNKSKSPFLVLEESAFSLENGLFMIATVVVMIH